MKKEKGITLIALIITIIVMLILVGVTINVALNGGIFEKAKTAKENTQRETDKEQLLAAVIGTLNDDGTVNEAELQAHLPDGFDYVSAKNVYKNTVTEKEYIVDNKTGKVEEYIDNGKDIVDDLIPTAEQKASAKFYQSDEEKTYSYASEVITYEESDVMKDVIISTSDEVYIWACNEATATVVGSTLSIQNMQPNKWYYGRETFAQYDGNCPINKNDYTTEEMESEEYVDRVIASFKVTNN